MGAPSLVDIVTAISDELVARLDSAGYPDLVAGKILMGRQRQGEFTSPPRVMFTPMGSDFFGAAGYTNVVKRDGAYTDEAKAQLAQRSIATEALVFEIRCWGKSQSEDPEVMRDDDFDMTRALYHAVIQAMSAPKIADGGRAVLGPLTKGGVELIAGKWVDAAYSAPQLVVEGREYVFGVRIGSPVLDRLADFAPSDVAAQPTTNYVDQDGSSGLGCSET